MAVTALLAGSLSALPTESAEAASMGPGYGAPGVGNGPLGSFIAESNGMQVYCLDAGAPTPTAGRTGAPTLVSDLREDSGAPIPAENLAKANAALTAHGQSGDNNWSAAVQLYMWELLDNADYNSHGYSGEVYYVNRAPAGARADIRAKVAQMRAETAGVTPAPTGGTATLSIEMGNSYDGRVIVSASPASASGTLTLGGAKQAGTGATSIPVQNGSVVDILGTPSDDQTSYSVAANAHFTVQGGHAANLNVYDTPGKQRTISAGTPGTSSFDARAVASDPLSTLFTPVVGTTVASKFVGLGETFVDGVQASVAAGSERWRQKLDGTYLPVKASGTLYGPFLTEPVQSATPPAGAPVVGTETLTLTGPGDYRSAGTLKADEAGYYTWVWSISQADQTGLTARFIPAGYSFADQFGLVAETHITPSSIVAVSQVEKAEQVLSGDLVDGIDVSVKDGAWLRKDGKRVPVVFEGTAYYVPGDTAPEVSLEIPEDAVEVGSRKLTVDKPGTFTTKADPLEAPAATAGFVSWVWEIRDENQPEEFRGYVAEWADPFGLPAETVKLQAPAVSTIAEADVPFGDPATDTALVTGPMPAKPATLTFEAFLQPSDDEPTDGDSDSDDDGADGESGGVARTLQGAPLASAAPVCTPGNRVFSTEANPITVTEAGEYVSDEVVFEKYGTYFWVATLTAHTGEIISQGECGDPDEVSTVKSFTVASKAVMNVDDQGTAYDTALVTGAVPEGTLLTFQAYKVDPTKPVCTVDTRVFDTADKPVALTAGMHDEDTEYDSPEHTFTGPGTYYWVETATLANGDVVHEGQCGAVNEITTVAAPPVDPPLDPPAVTVPPVLAFTGSSPLLGIVLAASLLVAAGLVLAARRRDRDAADSLEYASSDRTPE